MKISIAERLRPFCHLPGTSVILPGWGCQVQIFPCLIRLYHLKKSLPLLLTEINLDLKGPIQQFTICNDLEKGRLTVSGKTADGWMRYHLISSRQNEGIRLFVERAPVNGFSIHQGNKSIILRDKEWLDLLEQDNFFEPFQISVCDRLSLGNNKAQDWELIKRRLDLAEIFPILHRLGQIIPTMPITHVREGTLSLLEDCRQNLTSETPVKGEERWNKFLLGCFNSLLVPRLEDDDYQGLNVDQPLISLDISPLVILSEGARLIRKLFVQQDKDQVWILPHVFPSLHCGRLIDVPLVGGGHLSLEWTKKAIRRLILYAGQDQEISLHFRSNVKNYRLRQHDQEKGERKNCNTPLFLKKNCHYLFDNFQ